MNTQRGFTLLECVIALGLLAVGGLATAQLVTILGKSTSKVESSTEAVALGSSLLAQVNDARFFSPTDRDPGMAPGVHLTPVVGSTIIALGAFPAVNPFYQVSYEVVACTRCTDPFANGSIALGGADVVVTVDNAPGRVSGDRKLRSPMHFFLRKEFAPSNTDPTLIRGW